MKAEIRTEPHTTIEYKMNTLLLPALEIIAARSSMTPTLVIPAITQNRPVRRSIVSQSMALRECHIPSVLFCLAISHTTVRTPHTRQMIPLVVSGFISSGMKDAKIRRTTCPSIVIVGT